MLENETVLIFRSVTSQEALQRSREVVVILVFLDSLVTLLDGGQLRPLVLLTQMQDLFTIMPVQ
jgi:hypothetical protein